MFFSMVKSSTFDSLLIKDALYSVSARLCMLARLETNFHEVILLKAL